MSTAAARPGRALSRPPRTSRGWPGWSQSQAQNRPAARRAAVGRWRAEEPPPEGRMGEMEMVYTVSVSVIISGEKIDAEGNTYLNF